MKLEAGWHAVVHHWQAHGPVYTQQSATHLLLLPLGHVVHGGARAQAGEVVRGIFTFLLTNRLAVLLTDLFL